MLYLFHKRNMHWGTRVTSAFGDDYRAVWQYFGYRWPKAWKLSLLEPISWIKEVARHQKSLKLQWLAKFQELFNYHITILPKVSCFHEHFLWFHLDINTIPLSPDQFVVAIYVPKSVGAFNWVLSSVQGNPFSVFNSCQQNIRRIWRTLKVWWAN